MGEPWARYAKVFPDFKYHQSWYSQPYFPTDYLPTPFPVIFAVLDLLQLRPGETFYDLGAGDGRMVASAAGEHSVRAIGIEIDPDLVEYANAKINQMGLQEQAIVVKGDIFETDLGDADAISMYLPNDIVRRVGEEILPGIREGCRLVSYDFPFSGFERDKEIKAPNGRPLYLYQL